MVARQAFPLSSHSWFTTIVSDVRFSYCLGSG
jgi:hypothetical protein